MLSFQERTRRMLCQLKRVRGLSDHERLLFARSFGATPDERWAMHENFLRSLNLFTRSERKGFGYK